MVEERSKRRRRNFVGPTAEARVKRSIITLFPKDVMQLDTLKSAFSMLALSSTLARS